MLKDEYKVYEEKMRKSIDSVAADFAAVRAGRANAAVLDRISVDYYGTPTPIQQIASIGSPDPRQLLIQPWDASAVKLRPRHQSAERRQGHSPDLPTADGGAP